MQSAIKQDDVSLVRKLLDQEPELVTCAVAVSMVGRNGYEVSGEVGRTGLLKKEFERSRCFLESNGVGHVV